MDDGDLVELKNEFDILTGSTAEVESAEDVALEKAALPRSAALSQRGGLIALRATLVFRFDRCTARPTPNRFRHCPGA
jgi:hypothetical protein